MVRSTIRAGDLEHSSYECSKLSPETKDLLRNGNVALLKLLPTDQILREIFGHGDKQYPFKHLFAALLNTIPEEDFCEDGLALYMYLLTNKKQEYLSLLSNHLVSNPNKLKVFTSCLNNLIASKYSTPREKKYHLWFATSLMVAMLNTTSDMTKV